MSVVTWHRYLYRAGTVEFRFVGEVLGNTEAWFGFEFPFDCDMQAFGLIRADKMSDGEAASIGVTRWTQLDVPPPDDGETAELYPMLFRVAATLALKEGPGESNVRTLPERARRK